MYTCLLKRIVPFVVALKAGLLLVALWQPAGVPLKKVRASNAPEERHSRTWLIVRAIPAPDYTEREARQKGATDTLRLRALLDANGTVSEVELLSEASEEFAADAVQAARDIDFVPATEDGLPVSSWVTVDYNCSGYYFAHNYVFQCSAHTDRTETDWRVINE